MKILVLTSRYTATRDIIGEDFGRQTRLFSALKNLKHDIDFFVADYRKFEKKNTKLHGINVAIRPFGIFYFLSFMKNLNYILKNKKYDVLIATSDPLWGFIGYIFSKKHKVKFIYDLHDNYETYATYKLPFFGHIDNFVIKNANLVTTVSYTLKDKIKNIRKNNVFIIQNGFDDKLFKPLDKAKCRKLLKLPKYGKIIAYAGTIQRAQGLDILIDAFKNLKSTKIKDFRDTKNQRDVSEFDELTRIPQDFLVNKIGNIYLVLAGRFFRGEEKYIDLKQDKIIYLGSLPQDKIVLLINAADIAVVPNPDNDFTRYCFPYKVVEYMACNVPIVATNIGDISKLLSDYKDSLCKPNNITDMANKIKMQLNKYRVNYRKAAMGNTWSSIAKKLDKVLKQIK